MFPGNKLENELDVTEKPKTPKLTNSTNVKRTFVSLQFS